MVGAKHGDQAQKSGAAGLRRPPILTGAIAFVRPSDPISAATAQKRRRPQRRLEPARGDAGGKTAQRLVLFHADHRIIVAGHADVGDETRAAGQDAMIGARHMGMGADDQACLAVDEMAERPFLARRFGVDVDKRGVEALSERTEAELALDDRERIIERVHEDAAEDIHDQEPRALRALDHRGAAARRAGGIVGRPDQARLALDEDQRLALVEGVIAERHRIDADGAEILEDRLR